MGSDVLHAAMQPVKMPHRNSSPGNHREGLKRLMKICDGMRKIQSGVRLESNTPTSDVEIRPCVERYSLYHLREEI